MSKKGEDTVRPATVGLAIYGGDGRLVTTHGVCQLAAVQAVLTDAAWRDELSRRRLVALRPARDLSLLALLLPMRAGALVAFSEPPTDAVFEFVAAVDFAWDILHHLLTDPFDAMTIVDAQARVSFISPVHERFFGLARGEAIGRPVRDVIENTRLHSVLQTGQPEIGQVQRMQGADRVVSRIPIHRDGVLMGAVGRVMFKGPAQVDALHRRINALEKQVAFYRQEAKALRGRDGPLDEMVGHSAPMQQLRGDIAKVAPLDVSVLVTGESGTGKELVARALHRLSRRAAGALVTINAAALPANLVESELFGYEPGAFTGADRKGRRGRFEQAEGGTIFLDEIGDMPLDTQAKLLRVLQERTVERVGGDRPIPVDFRLVCATNRDLADMVARHAFRLDLFYRISPVVLRVPSLADRSDDVLVLARHLLAEFAQRHGRAECVLDSSAEAQLRTATWPGNVRQLRHVIERAVIFASGRRITGAELATASAVTPPGGPAAGPGPVAAAAKRMPGHDAVQAVLQQTGGNKREAARVLGISRSHLYTMLAAARQRAGTGFAEPPATGAAPKRPDDWGNT